MNLKRVYIFLIAAALGLAYVLYTSLNLSLDVQVKSRNPIKPPVVGEWVVDKYLIINDSELSRERYDEYLGKVAHFTKEFILFDQEICNNPSYKIKRVDASSYFWDTYKVKTNYLGIDEKNIYIITASSKDKYFDDYIKVNDNLLIKQADGVLLFLNRSDYKASPDEGDAYKSLDYKQIADDKEKEVRAKSGLLLALKYKRPGLNDGNDSYSYRTLWIPYSEGSFRPVGEVQDILLPRMNGFWRMGSDKKLWAYSIKGDNRSIEENKNFKDGENVSILFIGHDYVSIEDKNKKLQLLPIDNLLGEPIKLSQIYGKESSNSLLRGIGDLSVPISKTLSLNETNFGVIRRGGRWILRGRTAEGESGYKDFDIAYTAPKSIIMYDDLYPSFSNIKRQIQGAVDAFSSPNRDFVVVLTETELLVVRISDGKLSEINSILNIKDGETVIMAHWATGFYVDEWTKKLQ